MNNNNNGNNLTIILIYFIIISFILIIAHYKTLLKNNEYAAADDDEDEIDENNNNNNYYNIQVTINQKTFLKTFHEKLLNTYFNNNNNNNNNNDTNNNNNNNNKGDIELFPLVKNNNNNNNNNQSLDKNDKQLRLYNNIYDAHTGKLLLSTSGELRLYPNGYQIPHTCGFGNLFFNKQTKQWKCQCKTPEYFDGIFCDEPQPKMIIENKCIKVGNITDMKNTDISTFNPLLEGVCVECSDKNATPILSSPFPKCDIINKEKEEEEDDNPNPCFSDPMNNSFNSFQNEYVPGYGCKCDYYNGFVEALVPNSGREEEENIISNCCIKIGKKMNFLKSHLAYYTLNSSGNKPIQIHEYRELEEPYKSSFQRGGGGGDNYRFLVKQKAADVIHKQDWLNRCIKPTRRQKIRRLNYPRAKWPVVNKCVWVNKYTQRDETAPLSALQLANGRGFETKHWYELTDERYIQNAILGHPIVYGYNAPEEKWDRKVTLNPLGPLYGKYYGLTMLYKPGETVRLDTRGYDREKGNDKSNNNNNNIAVVTLPPDYQEEMMDKTQIKYIAALHTDYIVH